MSGRFVAGLSTGFTVGGVLGVVVGCVVTALMAAEVEHDRRQRAEAAVPVVEGMDEVCAAEIAACRARMVAP